MSSDRLAQLRTLLADEPRDAFLRYAVALELKRLGKGEEALDTLEALVTEVPEHIPTYYQLALLLADVGRTAEAMSACQAGALRCLVDGDRRTRAELLALYATLEDAMEP